MPAYVADACSPTSAFCVVMSARVRAGLYSSVIKVFAFVFVIIFAPHARAQKLFHRLAYPVDRSCIVPLCHDLLPCFVRHPVRKGFLNPAALELDLSGCSYVPKSVFKQLGFSCPRIIYVNLSMCSQVCKVKLDLTLIM